MCINLEAVKRRMEENGWNQARFAEMAGLSRSYVSRVLSGNEGGGGAFLEGLIKAFPTDDIRAFLSMDTMRTELLHGRMPIKNTTGHFICMADAENRAVEIVRKGIRTTVRFLEGGGMEVNNEMVQN